MIRRRLRALWQLAASVSFLGSGARARARILIVALLMPLKGRIPGVRSRWVRIPLRKLGTEVSCVVRQRSDLLVLEEVFVFDAYRVPEIEPPGVVFDLGSNIGLSVLYFHLRHPGARIFGFEPDPLAYAMLEENTRHLPNVHIAPVAVAGHDGRLPFFPSPETFASSLHGTGSGRSDLMVQARSLDTLMEELGVETIDLLKIDIEGAEYDVLRSFKRLDRVRTVIGELHLEMIDASREEFVALLTGFDVSLEYHHMPALPAAERYTFVARNRRSAGGST